MICFPKATAQVIKQDSLALVALYNKIPALASDTTWLNGNVSTWHGIQVQDNRVISLDLDVLINDTIPIEICALDSLLFLNLSGCLLIGPVPKCMVELSSLRTLYLTGNALTGVEAGADFSKLTNIELISIYYNEMTEMPDFMSIPSPNFKNLYVGDNHFNFDDLAPLLSKPLNTYSYSPQQPMLPYRYFVVHEGDSINFPDVAPLAGGDSNNFYQWKWQWNDTSYLPDSPRLINTNQSMMRIESGQVSDSRLYFCEMANPIFPGLVLRSGYIGLNVKALVAQTIIYLSSTIIYCPFNNFLEALTTGTAGRGVSIVSLDTTVATINPDKSVNLRKPGMLPLRVTAPADTIYRADTLYLQLTVSPYYPLPTLEVTRELQPGEGKDLHLSVPFSTHLSYQWATPNGQLFDTASITVSPFTSAEFGTYRMRVKEGSCLISELSEIINNLVYGKPVIYELITPNGDGDNETFYIENLDPSVQNEVSVFNAVHQIVYHQENYRNDWDGGNLPVGTYYYFIKYGEQTYKGNLYIKR
ncbi:MAG: gliding motility-associated C-terminal domain-containing protein [Cytophagaceae bacterium]|nr:gliding motility-associated C-terminal domain-containing protein [Cytophagaceae bacterium]